MGTGTHIVIDAAESGGAAGGDLTGTYPNPTIAAGAVVNASVSASAAIVASKLDLTSPGSFGTTVAAAGAFTTLTASTSLTLSAAPFSWGNAVASPTVTHTAQTTDVACTNLTITSQAPFATATGANRNPGNLVLAVPAKASGGTAGSIAFRVDGATVATVNAANFTLAQALILAGTSPAASGDIRAANGTTIVAARNAANGADLALLNLNSSDQVFAGAATGDGGYFVQSGATVGTISPSLTIRDTTQGTAVTITPAPTGATSISAAAGVTGFTLSQANKTTNGGTGATLTVQAQNETGTTSNGGPLVLASGTGTTAAGAVSLKAGATTQFQINATGVGFFAVAPVARAAALTQTYATATRTHAADTAADMATTAATNVAPFGFSTAAQADAIATKFNALRVDVDNLKQFVNALVDDMQAYGLEQ